MHITYFDAQTQQAQLISPEQIKTCQGMIWLDVLSTDTDWQSLVETEFGLVLEEQHVLDTRNPNHPPFYDDTDHYEMLIFRALSHPNEKLTSFEVESAPIVLLTYRNLLLSIHPTTKTNFDEIRQRWLSGSRIRASLTPAGILCLLLSWLTDQYLNLRVAFIEQLEHWQTQLLQPTKHFHDWLSLLKASSHLRHYRLALIEPQQTALDEWRDEHMDLDTRLLTRLTDVQEHFNRVDRDAEICQNDLENLVQIYFSASNQRMNDIMRVLTIASVIFLPLNLLAGIYGMNFEYLPGLGSAYGFTLVIVGMLAIVLLILGIFRWKKWL